MSAALTERLTEWVGPIVVKEVRQGLRARTFSIFFGLLLLACFCTALVAWAANDAAANNGPGFLATYLVGLGAIGYFVIPYTAFRSLLREREEETWVLLVLTGLGARQVVRGKFLSALSQAMLYASACAPFVLFSYYLNGVTVLQVLVALVLSFAWSWFLTAVGLALAAQPLSRAGRTSTHFAVIALLGLASLLAFAMTVALSQDGGRLLSEPGFQNVCLVVLYLAVAGGLLVLEGAAAGLALETEAPSKGPRLALALFIVGTWALACAACTVASPQAEGFMVASIGTSLVLVVAGFFAISEQDGCPRASRHVGWARPGALRSFTLVIGLLVASTVVWLVLAKATGSTSHSGGMRERALHGLVAAPAYVALYLSLAAATARLTPLRRLGEPMASRVSFLALVILGTLGPPLSALAMGERADNRGLNVLNPAIGLVNFVDRYYGTSAIAALGVLVAVAGVTVLLGWVGLRARDGERHA